MKRNIKLLIEKAKKGDKEAYGTLVDYAIRSPVILEKLANSLPYEMIFRDAASVAIQDLFSKIPRPKNSDFKIEFLNKDGFEYPYIADMVLCTTDKKGECVLPVHCTDQHYQWMFLGCLVHAFIATRMDALGVASVSKRARKEESRLRQYLSKVA